MTSTSAASRAGQLADTFGRTAKMVVTAFDDRLGDRGVSTPRFKVLGEVARLQPVRLADLARAVGISHGTASSLVDALVRDGLVIRASDEQDRRAIRLTTTPTGQEQARQWLADYADAAVTIFGCLADDEQRSLNELLTRVADSIQDAR